MAQHDMVIANADGATVRADINLALAAQVSQNSGAAAPATTYAHMPWVDITNDLFKIRNSANTAWVTVASWDGTTWIPYRSGTALGTAAIAGLLDEDTLVSDSATDAASQQSIKAYVDNVTAVPDAAKAPPEMANNVTDPAKDIDFAAGFSRAENTAAQITNTAMTKKLDASWVAGTNQGGLSSSLHPLAAAAATVWGFSVIIGGSADFIFDTDPDCANGIADHSVTAYRNTGAVRTDATPDIVPFLQIDDHFYLDVPVQDYSTGGSTSPVLHQLSVPLGRKMRPLHNHIMESTTTTLIHSLVTDPDQTATAPSATVRTASTRGTGEYNSVPILVYTDTSGQIRSEQSSTASLNIKGMTFGWVDRRGRDA